MTGEFNNLATNNTATTFSSATNNTATSDELSATDNYVRKMGTAYSAGKWTNRIIKVTGITLTISAAAILGGNVVTNAFIGKAPVVASDYVFKLEQYSIYYKFAIESNDNNYPVTFRLYEDTNKPIFTLDCSQIYGYEGYVDLAQSYEKIIYEIYFTNRLDYKRTLLQGVLTYLEE